MADGRHYPGYQRRKCPVCAVDVGTHREPVADERGEVVTYHDHNDGSRRRCRMAGEVAAIRAVAFTATDTGIGPRATADYLLNRPRGSRAADELLERLTHQERNE